MKDFKILMFLSDFRPTIGGAERMAEILSRSLMSKSCHVEVLTIQLKPEWPLTEDVEGLLIHRFPITQRNAFDDSFGVLKLPYALLRAWQIKQAVRKHIRRFDILHTHMASSFSALGMEEALRAEKKAICKIGSSGFFFDLDTTTKTSLFGRNITRRMIRNMDHWIATTQNSKEELIQSGILPERISLIPNGVEIIPLHFKSTPNSTARRFLYLGRLSKSADRDMFTMIKAFDNLASTNKEVELAIVGNGDLFEETRKIVSDCRNKERITMPGQQDSKKYIGWADCFVLPSRVEGMSNALLEAMSYGLACIANDIPSNREVLDNGRAGILVPVGNIKLMTEFMVRLSKVPGESARLGKLARSRAANVYDIDNIADKYIETYINLLDCRKSAP